MARGRPKSGSTTRRRPGEDRLRGPSSSRDSLIGVLSGESVASKGSLQSGYENVAPGSDHARCIVAYFLEAAQARGIELPEGWQFHRGQVFFEGGQVVEVRLDGSIPGDGEGAEAWPGLLESAGWSTDKAPSIHPDPAGQWALSPEDVERDHLSAVVWLQGERTLLTSFWNFRETIFRDRPGRITPDHISVPSAEVYYQARHALTVGQFVGSPGEHPTAALMGSTFRGYIQLKHAGSDGTSVVPPEVLERWREAMWRQVKELNDLDADALDLLSVVYLESSPEPTGAVLVNVDDLLRRRGIKPKSGGHGRRGGFMPDQRMRMMMALSHIQNVWLEITEMDVVEVDDRYRRRRKKIQAIQSRAFLLTDVKGQRRLDGQGYLDVETFLFRPGDIFGSFLRGPGRQAALLSAKALQYDFHRQRDEKRLARYLSWQWRCRAKSGHYVNEFKVRTLLEAIGVEFLSRRLALYRENLENALDVLEKDGVIAGWEYEAGSRDRATRKGHPAWLDTKIVIEAPDLIKEHYRHLESLERRVRKLELESGSFGERVQRWRKRNNLTQLQLAEKLGVAQAYISRIERDHVKESSLGPGIRKTLSDLLQGEGSS